MHNAGPRGKRRGIAKREKGVVGLCIDMEEMKERQEVIREQQGIYNKLDKTVQRSIDHVRNVLIQ